MELEIADAIFRRERSDDRKCVCCSQAKSELIINTVKTQYKKYFRYNKYITIIE